MQHIPNQVRHAAERAAQLQAEFSNKSSDETAVDETPSVDEQPIVPTINWEHKYQTVNGMLRAESERYKKLNTEFETYKKTTDATVAELNKQLRELKRAKEDLLTDEDLGLDAETIKGFDPDSIELIRRSTKAAYKAAVAKIRAQEDAEPMVASKPQPVVEDDSLHKQREQLFYQELGETVPDFIEVNKEQGFLAWLGERDDFGIVRDDHLQRAAADLDASRVAAIFNAYKASQRKKPTVQPSGTAKPPSTGPVAPSNLTASGYKQLVSEVARGTRPRTPQVKKLLEQYEAAYNAGTLLP